MRIPYDTLPLQFGDVHLPDGIGPHPVAVIVHGGFWFNAYDLELMTPMSHAFAQAGIAAWNIEYRRIGDVGGGFPGTFQDVARATDHLRTLAATHALDLNRIITIGHSAGGHLALWIAARGKIPAGDMLHASAPLKIRAAISLAGVNDLKRGAQMKLGGGAVDKLIGGSPDEFPARYATASPAEMLPLDVKQILIHGTADDRVPYEISQSYQEMAIARGDDATLVTLPRAGHFEVIDPRSREWARVMDSVRKVV